MNETVVLSGFSNFHLIDFRYHIDDSSSEDSFIEIIAKGHSHTRHLRFKQPSNLMIDEGFSGNISGMEIIDISERQWCDAQIEVRNFEPESGITFFAKSMIILSDETNAQ